ncbi:MAG TPA: ABC transporter ATP-binding protein [Epulopiscium sp.]|nr:ABC transporter ATP-binding protein [Candidatus Epulonipiscium sp.]
MSKVTKFLKPFTMSIIVVVVLMLLQSLSELYLPKLMADIVDKGIVSGDTGYILKIGGFMIAVAAVGTVLNIIASYLSSKVAAAFGRDLRQEVFSHVENLTVEKFSEIGTSSLITRTTNDITQIQQVLTISMRMMLRAPMMAIGGIMMATSKDPKLSMVLLFSVPIVIIVIAAVAKKGVPLFKVMQEKLDNLNLVVRENLMGIRVIRAFNRDDYEKKRFDGVSMDLKDTSIKANRIMGTLMPALMLILNLTVISIIWFGGVRIESGGMQVGDLMAFIQYVMQIMFSLVMLSMMFVMIPRAMVSVRRVNEVLEKINEIKDLADSNMTVETSKRQTSNKQGVVEFKDVSFKYTGAEEPVICNISFTANPGETTAIIGGTGSGKSTLINMIPRFYDVTQGSVLIGGIDVKDMKQEELRAKIGFVPQKSVLFSGTIAENIRYGKADAADEEVKLAAEIAQATEFIEGMKDGFDSQIAQGGTNISGGQNQRLSIARALVRKPEVYIFDDSFSALDFKTDGKLREALKAETRNSAMIVVAQRVATVMDAEQIIVLHEGQIVGKGTHKKLLESCKVYEEIVFSQLSKEEAS